MAIRKKQPVTASACGAVALDNAHIADVLTRVETHLLDTLADGQVSPADPTAPLAATVRELHEVIRACDPAHRCGVDEAAPIHRPVGKTRIP